MTERHILVVTGRSVVQGTENSKRRTLQTVMVSGRERTFRRELEKKTVEKQVKEDTE